MKRTLIATMLSFFVPGAGLCYVGRWRSGIVNLILVTATLLAIYFAATNWFNDYVHYLLLIGMAGSAGAAHAVARSAPSNSAAIDRCSG